MSDQSDSQISSRSIRYRRLVLPFSAIHEYLAYVIRPVTFSLAYQTMLIGNNSWLPGLIIDFGMIFFLIWVLLVSISAINLNQNPTNKDRTYERLAYIPGAIFLTLCIVYGMITLVNIANSKTNLKEIITLLIFIVPYFLLVGLQGCMKKFLFYGLQNIFMTPTYSVIVPITSILNWKNGSWGTRGLQKQESKEEEKDYSFSKKILSLNIILMMIVAIASYIIKNNSGERGYYILIGIIVVTGHIPTLIFIIWAKNRSKKSKYKNFPGIYLNLKKLKTHYHVEPDFFTEDKIASTMRSQKINNSQKESSPDDSELVPVRASSSDLEKIEIIDTESQVTLSPPISDEKSGIKRSKSTSLKDSLVRSASTSSFRNGVMISATYPPASPASIKKKAISRSSSKNSLTQLSRSGSQISLGWMSGLSQNFNLDRSSPVVGSSKLNRSSSTISLGVTHNIPKNTRKMRRTLKRSKSIRSFRTRIISPVIILVPVYKEDYESLKKTVDSILKMKFGLLESALGKEIGFLEHLMVIFIHDKKIESPEDPTWMALKKLVLREEKPNGNSYTIDGNSMMLYSKTFTKEFETVNDDRKDLFNLHMMVLNKDKNRGKRNSQILGYKVIKKLIKAGKISEPEFLLMVDSDTSFIPEAPARLVWPLIKNPKCVSSCGNLQVRNLNTPFNCVVTSQVLEYAINFDIYKWAETVYQTVECLPGALMAIRFDVLDKKIMIKETGYLRPREELEQGELWNRLEIGEDRWLTTILITEKDFHGTIYVPSALGSTRIPENVLQLVLQRKRWVNSTLANLIYLSKALWHREAT